MAARIEGLIANQRELTNAVSHELRTPIARLSFELDQLKQQSDPSQNRELIADMYADLGELEEMVSELLTYASLEQGATVIVREDIQARDWLDSVVGSVALEAEAAGVQLLIVECPAGTVRIEPRFMARAVINLLRNAIRYADERVHVSLTRAGIIMKCGSTTTAQVCHRTDGRKFSNRSRAWTPAATVAPVVLAWAWRWCDGCLNLTEGTWK